MKLKGKILCIYRKLSNISKDKLLHFLICWFIALAGSTINPFFGYSLAVTIGYIKEERDIIFDEGDLKADFIGAFLGALMGLIFWG